MTGGGNVDDGYVDVGYGKDDDVDVEDCNDGVR